MIIPTKIYEKPDSGIYHGVLADIVDLGLVTTTFKNETHTNPMVRFVWVLDQNDSTGKPLQATERFNVSNYHERSNIYKRMKQILGQAPDVKQDVDLVLGVTRRLVIQRDTSADGAKDFSNITGILPAEPGKVVPIPTGFVRDRDKPVQEQAKYRAQLNQKPAQKASVPQVQPTSPQPTQQTSAEQDAIKALLAQVKALQAAQAKSPVQNAQGADVSFSAPTTDEF